MQSATKLPKYPPVFFVRITNSIRRSLLKINRRFTHPNVVMLEHVQNIWLLGAISVAAELGIADLLKCGAKTTAELASLTGMLDDPLYRMMRLLASEGIFKETEYRRFINTKVSESLQEGELKYFIRHTLNKTQFRISGEMIHSIKTGKSTLEQYIDKDVFEHIGQSKELNELYNRAMTNASKMQVAAIMSVFDFGKFRHIVDVGGGTGFFISEVLSKYSTLDGTLFDLPHVLDNASYIIDNKSFTNRLRKIGGSFFDTIPEGGDLYAMKNIMHCWNDEEAVIVLQNIRKAIPPEAKLLIIETIIEKDNNSSWGKMSDIYMLIGIGGRERTRDEYSALMERTGFIIEKVYRTVSPLSIIVVIPDIKYKTE